MLETWVTCRLLSSLSWPGLRGRVADRASVMKGHKVRCLSIASFLLEQFRGMDERREGEEDIAER